MAKQSKPQQETIERVMYEFKYGELRIGRTGPKVKNPKQAIAVALHEAGATKTETPSKNRATLRRTKGKEPRGETAQAAAETRSRNAEATKADLYAEARRRGIPGRSGMSKPQLAKALRR